MWNKLILLSHLPYFILSIFTHKQNTILTQITKNNSPSFHILLSIFFLYQFLKTIQTIILFLYLYYPIKITPHIKHLFLFFLKHFLIPYLKQLNCKHVYNNFIVAYSVVMQVIQEKKNNKNKAVIFQKMKFLKKSVVASSECSVF